MKAFIVRGYFAPVAWGFVYFVFPEHTPLVTGVSSVLLIAMIIGVVVLTELQKNRVRKHISSHNYVNAVKATRAVGRCCARIAFANITAKVIVALATIFCIRHFVTESQPFHFFGKTWWIWFLVLHEVAVLCLQSFPVMVFLLGASSRERLEFQNRAATALFPFRVAGMMETKSHGDFRFAAGHCFRVTEGSWQGAFRTLVDASMVIILDLREPYPHEDLERQFIISSQNEHKTVCLVNDSSDPRIIEGARVMLSEGDAIQKASQRLVRSSKGLYVPDF